MKKVLDMKQKRAALVQQAREILDKAEAEKRDLTAEEEEQYDRIMADVDRLGKDIEREERLAALESDLEKRDKDPIRQVPQAEDEKRDKPLRATEEYRAAFWDAIRMGRNALDAEQLRMLRDPEVRALVVGIDSAGGYTVPDEFERQLIQKLEENNVMRGLATVITTSSGDREIPVEADKGQAAWLGEEEEYTESDATFGQKVLRAYKLGRIMKISEELLYDSAFNLEQYTSDAFGRSFGEAEEAAFVNGDGIGKPRGVIQDAEVGHTAATTNAITGDDLIELYHSLKRPYRSRATWLANDSTIKAIRKLKDNDGQYLWQPGLQAGQPDRILGRPVAVSQFVPEIGASEKPLAFGAFSYYWIADRQGRIMQRLDELYAKTGHVGFRMRQRVDGRLILEEAVKVLQMASV
jgi:HK97 family phage major capsid protein